MPALSTRLRRPAAFGVVGVLNSAMGLGAYSLAVGVFRCPYLLGLVVGYVVSGAIAFPLHRRMVFRVRGSVLRDLLRYEAVTASGLALNALLLTGCVELLKVPTVPAEVLVTGVLGVVSYVAHRDFSFARRVALQREA